MKTHFVLEYTQEPEFFVLAINTHIKGYKLCWNINRALQLNFEKKKDHNVEENLWFSRYSYICEEGVEYNLLANRSKKGYLIPKEKSINYFLVVEKRIENQKQKLLNKLKKVKDILRVFELETKKIKEIERFIFNDKEN